MTRITWTAISLASLLAGCLAAHPALAAKPAVDYFSAGLSTTNKQAMSVGSFPQASKDNPVAVKWFEQLDDLVFSHKITAAERVILSRPFNQESERVEQWVKTANAVISRYRELSKELKTLSVPDAVLGVKEYRDLIADWYSDTAGIYEDLVKPRTAAKTMEELDSGLNEITERARSLSQTNANLKAMDMSLRKTYRVHLARYDDALQQYVRSKK